MEFAENLLILNLALCELVEKQQNEIALLKAEISLLKNPKNSKNSSIPPSKDENRVLPNQSLRVKSGKKVGGQPGHKGHTLQMIDSPTETVVLKSNICSKCGNNITNNTFVLSEKRQVIDIPPIVPLVREYQSFSTICNCGTCNKAEFPDEITAPVQYGSTVQALAVYMNTRQYVPFARIKEFFSCVTGIQMSEGTIQNMLKKMAVKATPFYNQIKAEIEVAQVLGGDETSFRCNGKKGWYWVLQNNKLTFIHASDNRGFATLNLLFPNGLPNAIVVHDAYAAWFQLLTAGHQLCLAHLQRDLNYLTQIDPCEWVTDIKKLFYEAIEWKSNPKNHPHDFKEKLKNKIENLPISKTKKLNAFTKRIKKFKESLLVFLEYKDVPPDNNGSERAIRLVKVKSKVSGQFKSLENANMFAILRSVIDTSVKNNQPILEKLQFIANFRAE